MPTEFPELKNDRLIKALRQQPVDCTPIWLMRQAGRYLPEYREVRAKAGSFMNLCTNPELACEVTLQPLERFPLDAAILFSDILTIPDAMGLGLHFVEGEGPKFERPVRNESDVERLRVVTTEEDLKYVVDAVTLIRHELGGRVPLIGFSGSPWTLATYMIEGQSTRDFSLIKKMLYCEPVMLHRILDVLTESVIGYLNAQIRAGAQAVQVFDTWGGVLTTTAYREFSLRYLQKIVTGIEPSADGSRVPVVLFTKGGGMWLEEIIATGCDAVGLDWSVDIGSAFDRFSGRVAMQGNLDPAILRSHPEVIEEQASAIISAVNGRPGHVFNLGHGITPDVPPDHVTALVHAVHSKSVNQSTKT
jgi:uroporphyrinogen decarboxylase